MNRRARPGAVVSVGFYDGVHLGHRRLISSARAIAADAGLSCVVVTFDRHPAAVLRPELAPRLLTAVDHKLELLENSGVDGVHLVHFDHTRAKESAEEFVEEVLVAELAAREVVVGVDFRFGFERRGNLAYLGELGRIFGFSAHGVELVRDPVHGEVVTSSRIRRLIGAGELAEAAALLDRPHEVRGFVTNAPASDDGPTGLVVDTDLLLPPEGRYRVALRLGDLVAETSAAISGELVELGPFAGAAGPGVHPGVRVACAFLSPDRSGAPR